MAKLGTLKPLLRTADLRRVKPERKTTDPYYLTPEHRAWAADVIAAAGGCCQDPEHHGPNPPRGRLFADHIKERRDAPHLALDPKNGMARCGSCHTRKTAAERARRLGA